MSRQNHVRGLRLLVAGALCALACHAGSGYSDGQALAADISAAPVGQVQLDASVRRSSMQISGTANRLMEWGFQSRVTRDDPWGETSLTVNIKGPDGKTWAVPAYWAGGQDWRVRFTPTRAGSYSFATVCQDASDAGLHQIVGTLQISEPKSDSSNVFERHGAVRMAETGRGFTHADGTPFFWFGDTWWMLMTDRVSWPDGFRRLTADRVKKGFTVVQIVIGFQPDTVPFDGRDDNLGGSPWEKDYKRINPAYFDQADLRMEWLVRSGIAPCVVGSWGYHIQFMGQERMQSHWKYLVARYGAMPVIWCLAGEGAMPYYLTKKEDRGKRINEQVKMWSQVAAHVRKVDPFRRPLTIHPRDKSWLEVDDPSLLDFHMLQASHLGTMSLERCWKYTEEARSKFPDKTVVNAEPPYEDHMGFGGPMTQRHAFWSSMLSGASGFTYGAAGIFQGNDRDRPAGQRPNSGAYDGVFWDDSMNLPGSGQVGHAKKILAELPFMQFEPHPEWFEVKLDWGAEAYQPPFRIFGAGVPGVCRVVYIPSRYYHTDGPLVKGIEKNVKYHAWYHNPFTGAPTDLGEVKPDADGNWKAPHVPFMHDWVFVMKKI